MSTVAELLDRLYREYLYAGDDQPSRTTLTGAVTDSATVLGYDEGLLDPDEEDLLAPGVAIEVGRELMLITDADQGANSITVRRGHAGTTAAAHDSGALVTIAPTFVRQAAFDALADNVVALYPRLYGVRTSTVSSVSSDYNEIPADALDVLAYRSTATGQYVGYGVEFIDNFPPSSTGKAARIRAGVGTAGHVVYRSRFVRPTAESDDMSDLGVEDVWERIVVVGAAHQLLVGREMETVSREFVTEPLSAEAYPEGSNARKAQALWRTYQQWLDHAARDLYARRATPVVFTGAF